MRHLRLPVAATRLGMIAEQVVRAFWPLWSVAFVLLAPLMMGWHDSAPRGALLAAGALGGIALLAALVWGARRYRHPPLAAAVARVDAALPGRPIAALTDSQAIGRGDAASEAVWQAHVARMQDRTKDARAIQPDLRVSDRDPYGLRFVALLFFVAALFFGSLLRVGTVGAAIGGSGPTLAAGPVWEGWVEPPAYTGKPSLYLNDIPQGRLRVPEGSKITLRFYGEEGALTLAETVSGEASVAADPEAVPSAEQTFSAVTSGQITVDGPGGIAWDVTVVADAPPGVDLTGPIEAEADGELAQPFTAYDDYGVESGTATITLDLAAVERIYGLAVDPDPIAPLVLDLPMPFGGDRTDFEEFLIENLSEHPLANLPVTLQLSVTDAIGQTGTTPAEPLVLPGLRFFQPFANAVVEQRRALLWSKSNLRSVNQILRAISHRPEGLFSNETTYLRLSAIIRRLDGFLVDGFDDAGQAEVAEAMWELALQLEFGRLTDARERLERAQERLAEAMRNGASDEEIAELMQELREAMNDYMRMLAENAEPGDGTDQPSGGEGTEMSMSELQALMDRIEELMQEGRMAEAQELMEQLNQLMENMRVTQGEGGDGPPMPGEQSMQDLAETLREQENLSDEAFRQLQEQFNQGQQPGQPQGQAGQQPGQPQGQQPGQQQGQGQGQSGQDRNAAPGADGNPQADGGEGNGAPDGRSLADRQQALRDELQRQRNALPGLDGEAGDIARRSLDRAEGAMDGAEEALRGGDLGEAIDRQAEAMDALRDGMRDLGQALAQNQNGQQGQGTEQGTAAEGNGRDDVDPLGRRSSNNGDSLGGRLGTDENMLNLRAEQLRDEIRRRSIDQERPQVERDYMRRLMDRF